MSQINLIPRIVLDGKSDWLCVTPHSDCTSIHNEAFSLHLDHAHIEHWLAFARQLVMTLEAVKVEIEKLSVDESRSASFDRATVLRLQDREDEI